MSYAKFRRPPALPAGAVGFLAERKDRPGHLAAFMADGTLRATFGCTETAEQIAAQTGIRMEPIAGTAFHAMYS